MRQFGFFFTIMAMLATTACLPATTTMIPPSGSYSGIDGEAMDTPPPAFAQFTDIPIPDKAIMDLDKTLLLGSSNAWIGRLVFSAPYNTSGMFDFYMSEMTKFGWHEITVVRSESSVMTFKLDARIATIQLNNVGSNASRVSFTVSPEGVKQSR
ncbi:MAG: hypothetical protein KAJ75_04365 [Alphaproteobacteria bacterium]|nr:hypothetical protein [Alphaproteobacteria bacterium]